MPRADGLDRTLPRGAYVEREEPRAGRLEAVATAAAGLARRARARLTRWDALVGPAEAHGRALAGLDTAALLAAADDLRGRLRLQGFQGDLVARAFALVREVAHRELGQRHHDVQLVGGAIILRGMVAEMEAGEGKTLAATLPACTAALAGLPVHVITVNDYLAARDAEAMGPVYRALGLSVGVIVHDREPGERRAAYACDVTYGTNKEVAFDYLRDRIVLGHRAGRVELQVERLGGGPARADRLLHRGLTYAIVDEADSVLIDEARTPLIISRRSPDLTEARVYQTALALAGELEPGRDFVIDERERSVRLTPPGEARLDERGAGLGGVWYGRRRREDLVRQALTAQHLIRRDRHYLVRDARVQIIDEYTGRVMADRAWEHGLHQLIEAKEGCEPTGHQDAMARISYQRFFRRYLRLAGMTGTAREVAGELWSVYGLVVVPVPTHRPVIRQGRPDTVHPTLAAKWEAVADGVARLHQEGRPVLVGTRSVAASEEVSRVLTARGLAHRVLSARQDGEEAAVVAEAGAPGRITVATNMAGRGTDIRLGPGVAERGGLHVIATERHEARRIDRQLFGRCGRQGDPGSFEAILSVEDELLVVHGGLWRRLAAAVAGRGGRIGRALVAHAFRRSQRAAERLHARMRADLLALDEHLDTALAFAGRRE